MSKNPYGANSEMLLLHAWLSTLDLAALLRKDRETRPWERPFFWDHSQYPSFPEELLREQVETTFGCFQRDPIYGPLLEALARERLTYINFALLSWAIELQDLTNANAAFHISNNPYYTNREQKSEAIDETDAFWRVACSHVPLADRLKRLSKTWQGDVCHGASELRTFFTWYLDLIQRPLQLPFFLVEYVRRSLLEIDWHKIAAKLLDVPAHQDCHCVPRTDAGAVAEYLDELVKVTGDEIMLLDQRLPEPERTQVLLLGDLCRETTKAMHRFSSSEEAGSTKSAS